MENSTKRMKTSQAAVDIEPQLSLASLPEQLLTNTSSYLPKTSSALLAVALTAPTSSWCSSLHTRKQPSSASMASISLCLTSDDDEGYVSLDFGDLEDSLAHKLKDSDVASILSCVNAHEKLKGLKLSGCNNITGSGLGVLRGSTVLEQIDLSIFGSFYGNRARKISAEAVVPILNSIMETERTSLEQKHVRFPSAWKYGLNGLPSVRPCRGECHRFMIGSGICNCCDKCSRCTTTLHQRCGSSNCNSLICGGCNVTCGTCSKVGCKRCLRIKHCRNVECTEVWCRAMRGNTICSTACHDCDICHNCATIHECDMDRCQRRLCEDCIETCEHCDSRKCYECQGFSRCEGCGKAHCGDCFNGEDLDVKYCSNCDDTFCRECLVLVWQAAPAEETCGECFGRYGEFAPVVMEGLRQENEQLRQENEQLPRLREENERLRQQIRELGENGVGDA